MSEVIWTPQPGPQTAMVAAGEFEVFGGGAVFGGKTASLIYGGLRDIDKPHYRALILRQSFTELREIIDETQKTFPLLGARWKESEKRWFFPTGAIYEFGYCSSYLEALQYRGQQYSYIAFDEIGDLRGAEKIWKFLSSRCRSTGPGILPRMRCTGNPGGVAHGWLKRYFIVPCGRDGSVVHDPGNGLQRRFIPARAADNPIGLRNNPQYMQQLEGLPELMRKQLLEGDWDAGSGVALEELSLETHLVRPFAVPDHWDHFGAFDWGFAHWWVFGHFVVNEDGRVYVVQTLRGRKQLPRQIAASIKDGIPEWDRLNPIPAGHDVKSDDRSRADNTPTIKESFQDEGIYLTDANTARRAGLQKLREWTAWKKILKDPKTGQLVDGEPMLLWFDNPGNRRSIEAIMEIATDEDDPNMMQKVDADATTGEGGDDDADMCLAGDVEVCTVSGPVPIVALTGTEGWLYGIDGRLYWYHSVRQTSGWEPILRVTLTDGRTVDLTGNHPVLTPYGWRGAGALISGDRWVDVGPILRYITVHGPNRPQPHGTGVPGSAVLAHGGRILPAPWEVAAPGSLESGARADPRRFPGTSHRPRPCPQPEFQPTSGSDTRARREHMDTGGADGSESSASGAVPDHRALGYSVAPLTGRAAVAQGEWCGGVEERALPDVDLPAMRGPISDSRSATGEVLPPELQGEGAPGAATVRSIAHVGHAPVYNLEVDDPDHAYAVVGGLIVHNCRYAMSERIVPARTLQRATFNMNDPAQLAWEAEQQRRHYTRSHLRRREDKVVSEEFGTQY